MKKSEQHNSWIYDCEMLGYLKKRELKMNGKKATTASEKIGKFMWQEQQQSFPCYSYPKHSSLDFYIFLCLSSHSKSCYEIAATATTRNYQLETVYDRRTAHIHPYIDCFIRVCIVCTIQYSRKSIIVSTISTFYKLQASVFEAPTSYWTQSVSNTVCKTVCKMRDERIQIHKPLHPILCTCAKRKEKNPQKVMFSFSRTYVVVSASLNFLVGKWNERNKFILFISILRVCVITCYIFLSLLCHLCLARTFAMLLSHSMLPFVNGFWFCYRCQFFIHQ